MKIAKINLQGFRNFDNETIHLEDKTLIIGANDVGKSNLLFALRILFDRSLSDLDLELKESDFNTLKKSEEILITAYLEEIIEDCLLSMFKGNIKDNKCIIRFSKKKDTDGIFLCGFDETVLGEISRRNYIKKINMEYVNSNRDLFHFIKKNRNEITKKSKDSLKAEEQDEDTKNLENLQKALDTLNINISKLNYIKKSLDIVNDEMEEISPANAQKKLKFVSSDMMIDELLTNIELVSESANANVKVGGDGRNNQIYLATWVARQKIKKNSEMITFFAIEEPEAHLHPHQQRNLSHYLINLFTEQVLITTHSPNIATDFLPNKIVRLYEKDGFSKAATGGCSYGLGLKFDDFGFRLNSISAEIFFSEGVILVEGPSEEMLYKVLSKDTEAKLDSKNINIFSVNGIGFKPYIEICKALDIPFVFRTDNDVFNKKNKEETVNYYAGVKRAYDIYKLYYESSNDIDEYWTKNNTKCEWIEEENEENIDFNTNMINFFSEIDINISIYDLETDLVYYYLFDELSTYYEEKDKDKIIKKMKRRKAENMFAFLKHLYDNNISLAKLKNEDIYLPIKQILNKVAVK